MNHKETRNLIHCIEQGYRIIFDKMEKYNEMLLVLDNHGYRWSGGEALIPDNQEIRTSIETHIEHCKCYIRKREYGGIAFGTMALTHMDYLKGVEFDDLSLLSPQKSFYY